MKTGRARSRPLTAAAVMVVMFTAMFANVEPVISQDPSDAATANHTSGDGETTDERIGYGDTNTGWIPDHATFAPNQDVELVPCVDIDEHDQRVPREICSSFQNGYSKGVKVWDHYDNQRVCFSVVGPSPEPTQYRITDIEDYPVILTPVQSAELYGRYPPRTDQPLGLAVTRFNFLPDPDVDAVYPHHANFPVATVENYASRGSPPNKYYEWPYSLYQGNGVPVPDRNSPPVAFDRHIRPTHHTWNKNILGYKKDVYFRFEWTWTRTGWDSSTHCVDVWDPDAGPIDPITGLPTGEDVEVCTDVQGPEQSTSHSDEKWANDTSPTISTTNPTEPAGQPASVYADNMETQVRNFVVPTPSVTVPTPTNCPYDTCTSSWTLVTDSVTDYPTDPQPTTAGYLFEDLPAFWQAWELWGERFKTEDPGSKEILIKLKEGDDGDTGPRGIGWIFLENDYKIDYFDCYSTRNGGYIQRWQVAVPYPRQPATLTNLTPGAASDALVNTPILPPHPQSISGMFTDSHTPGAQSAPPVHVPIPIFDIGSGVFDSPTAPDGNKWAIVRSIPETFNTTTLSWEYPECVDVNGIPVCLALALRPWRAIWYIEPPPVKVLDPTPPDPTPKDVRACAYSTSSTSSLLSDAPLEQTNTNPTYQVVVDTRLSDNAAMMHTLQDLNSSPSTQPGLEQWLTDWLYGTGSNLARAYGQDQVNPDRYCWYKWYQAHNLIDGADGYRGILSVEWLATFYLGVPRDPYLYCLPGAHAGIETFVGSDAQNSGTFNCGTSRNVRGDAARKWFRLSAAAWTEPGGPTFTMEFLDRSVSRVSQCYVGRRRVEGMSTHFEWYLQAAAILYDNNQNPATHEPMHPLGGGREPATSLTDTAPSSTWWREGISTLSRVATPQNLTSALASDDPDRLYLDTVTQLAYPSDLSDTYLHQDCNQIPVWTVGIPCNQWAQTGSNRGQCTGKEWFSMFGENPGNPHATPPVPPTDIEGQLWAWWAQQIGEVRHQVFPIPVDP